MARKKTGRQATKRPSGRGTSASMQKLEKDFKGAPNRMSAQIAKEIRTLKATASKLKNNSNKLKTKVKSSETRLKAANKNKSTPAGKKQFSSAKKLHANNLKAQTTLEKQIKENTGLLESATQRQAKFAALKKHISQFEKDWNAQSRKSKTTAKKGKSKRASSRRDSQINRDATQQQNQPNYQTELDEQVRLDETTEVTS